MGGATGGATAPTKDVLDFIVIGAQKAATTTLFEHLRRHPDVALPPGKEAPFFSHDEIYQRGWRPYIQEITRSAAMSDPGKAWGTVTPAYMMGGVLKPLGGAEAHSYDERTVPERIRAQLPDVRLVAILRDPVERAVSHHGMLVGRGGERRSFDEAVEQLLEPEALRAARAAPTDANGYVTRGEYGRILGAYLDVFPSERLLVLFTDELERAPAELLRRLYGFIGVREDFLPEDADRRYFVARAEQRFHWRRPASWLGPSSPISPQGLQRGVRRVPGVRSLWHALPFEARRSLWRPYSKVAVGARRLNRRGPAVEGPAKAPARPETIERLREHFAEDTPRLVALLGGQVPYWQREAS